MQGEIYWIPAKGPGRIGIMARPRGGDWLQDEIRSIRAAGTRIVVSLLEPREVQELELHPEESLCLQNGLEFISVPIPDRGIPGSRSEIISLVDGLRRSVEGGQSLVIHCRQGIGRSSLLAALILISLGISADDVFDLIAKARGCPVPDTPEQIQFVLSF